MSEVFLMFSWELYQSVCKSKESQNCRAVCWKETCFERWAETEILRILNGFFFLVLVVAEGWPIPLRFFLLELAERTVLEEKRILKRFSFVPYWSIAL